MQRRALDIGLRFAGTVTCAAILACSRATTADPADVEAARVADSAKSVQAARSRSSASQAHDFTMDERARFTRVEQMIQAQFAGVQVTNSGSSYSIRIRGTSSFAASNEPLIIIDGAQRSTGELSGMNPRDVVRIEIVKDAAAFYGVRGANGVIIITTRRAS